MLAALGLSLGACSQPDSAAQSEATADPAPTAVAGQPAPAVQIEASVDQTPPHLQEGKDLYQYWCSACHAPGPGHPGTQALEARYQGAIPAVLEDRTNLPPELVELVVRNGISIMPFFRKTEINDEELAAIGAYLSHNPDE